MKSQRQGSLTDMVGQDARIHQDLDSIPTVLTPRQAELAAKFAALGRAALKDAAQYGSVSAAAPPPPEQVDSNPAERFQQDYAADRPRREARRNVKAKKQEHREARLKRRPDQQQKPRGLDIVTDWLARECAGLVAALEVHEADELAQRIEGVPASLEEAQRRLYAAQAAKVRIQHIGDALTPCERPSADDVAGDRVADLTPKRGRGAGTEGPVRLWRVLHLLAIYRAERLRHHPSATQEVVHSAAELLAAKLRVCPRTVSRWTDTLEAAGLIEARPHYTEDLDISTGEVVTRVDGTVYAVALQPGHTPRLTYGDLRHRYRDLTADRAVGRTAYRYAKRIDALRDDEKNMSGSNTLQQGAAGDPEQIALQVLQQWAVTPGGGEDFLDPRYSLDPDIFREDEKISMQTVIYDLPLIADEQDPDRRRVLVHHAAGSIAAALGDEHSRAYYAGLIWAALAQGWRGLQALAAQLARFEVDRREWDGHMRHAPALLTSRTRRRSAA